MWITYCIVLRMRRTLLDPPNTTSSDDFTMLPDVSSSNSSEADTAAPSQLTTTQ